MKDSDYAFLIANVFLAQFVGKVWAAILWAVHTAFYAIFLYLGR
jgi:hypothetical protein